MSHARYFRRQADICLRLSLIASDDAISTRLVTMAKEYLATSEALAPPTLASPTSSGTAAWRAGWTTAATARALLSADLRQPARAGPDQTTSADDRPGLM